MAFHCTDYDTGETRVVTLAPQEFLRRYLQHTLPQGFHRVPYYGLWASANRPALRALQLTLAASLPPRAVTAAPALSRPPPRPSGPKPCPTCGSAHRFIVDFLKRDEAVQRTRVRWPPA